MALDPLLFDTYRQYKAGTARVMTWLASKAPETTILGDLFPAAAPENKGKGRLKGKARNAAKNASQKHLLPLEFVTRIAKSIATISKVNVPKNIIRTLEEVIAARTACSDYYSEQQGLMQTSNQKHQYFIEVLRETLEILKPLSQASDQTNGTEESVANTEAGKDFATLSNRFAYLELEEPTEWTSGPAPSKSKKDASKIELELEPTDEDISFAIFCFLKDLTDIRHYVRQTWAEYREHQLTFTTAALTANTAISIFRRLNEEFLAEFPQFSDHGAIIEYLYNGYCDPNSQDEQDFASYNGPNFKVSSKIFFCDNTCHFLREFFMSAELSFYQEGYRQKLRLTLDEETLLKCLSLLGLLSTQVRTGNFFNDQLIQGLHMLKTNNPDKHIHTWVVFAVQLLVDTRRVVGVELGRCLHEAHALQRWMSATLSQSQLFGRTNTVNRFYQVNPDLLLQMKKNIDEKLKDDYVQEILEKRLGDRAARYSWGKFYLFRNHPMLLGLITQYFLVELHEIGIELTGSQAAVTTAVHFYNAAHQCGAMPARLEWTDMERVIDWQGSSFIFLGDRPKNASECFRHYQLIMGISATMMSKDRHGKSTARPHITARNTTCPMSQKKNRLLRFMSTYIELMHEPSGRRGNDGGSRWKPSRAVDEPLVMLEMLVKKYLESNAKIKENKSTTRPKVHHLSMISIFKDILRSEEKVFRFDLFALNQRCVELMRSVQKICVEQSPLDYPPKVYGVDDHINSCFSHMMAGEVVMINRQQPTRFTEACLLVKDLIEGNGGAEEYEKSKYRCFIKGSGDKQVTDSFSTPVEDTLPFSLRSMFSQIIIDDGGSGLTTI